MSDTGASGRSRALAVRGTPLQSDSSQKRRSVRSEPSKQWQPPEGLAPDDVLAVIEAVPTERDRLLLRVLWTTGARVSEALALRATDVRRDSLVLPNLKNPGRPTKRVFLPVGQADPPGALLLWAKQHEPTNDQPIFFVPQACGRRCIAADLPSTNLGDCAGCVRTGGRPRPSSARLALWQGRRARADSPHPFRHERVRHIVRATRTLPVAQRQAGWSRLQMAYLSVGDHEEVREPMRGVQE